jgi:glycosyltransferase involved in cell wall biosynthesis
MRHGLSRPFVFYVGGWEKRKNLPFLLRAFAAAKETTIDLALAGQADETTRVALLELATALGIGSQLRLLGRVPDEDLPALYAAALCFVYPSVDEGFGLQLCEAMAAGCPVLAANKTSLPEVLGTGGELFEVADPRVLGNLIRRVALDLNYRQELVRRARNRSTDFSWKSAAVQTMEVYQRLLSSGQAGRRQ